MESILETARSAISRCLSDGEHAVDATVGNGVDTRFLASCVGPTGIVYGFDIQELALDTARYALDQAGLRNRVKLVLAGHEELDRIIPLSEKGKIGAVMFNLGYQPRGNKEIVTKPESTIAAATLGVQYLRPGGLVSIVAYRGHPGGVAESDAVLAWAANLDQKEYEVARYEFVNQVNLPPFLILIERL